MKNYMVEMQRTNEDDNELETEELKINQEGG